MIDHTPMPGRTGSARGPLPPTLDRAPGGWAPTPGLGDLRILDHVRTGYVPGLVGELASLQARVMAPYIDVDHRFEAARAGEIGAFLDALTPNGGLWTARLDGRIVGSAALDSRARDLPSLRWVALEPPYRGRGIGRRLLRSALGHARMRGAAGVRVEFEEALREAHDLYRSLGFRVEAVAPTAVAVDADRTRRMVLRFGGRAATEGRDAAER
jgi:GNAT superfamily N-acetyltransferase